MCSADDERPEKCQTSLLFEILLKYLILADILTRKVGIILNSHPNNMINTVTTVLYSVLKHGSINRLSILRLCLFAFGVSS